MSSTTQGKYRPALPSYSGKETRTLKGHTPLPCTFTSLHLAPSLVVLGALHWYVIKQVLKFTGDVTEKTNTSVTDWRNRIMWTNEQILNASEIGSAAVVIIEVADQNPTDDLEKASMYITDSLGSFKDREDTPEFNTWICDLLEMHDHHSRSPGCSHGCRGSNRSIIWNVGSKFSCHGCCLSAAPPRYGTP